MAAISEGARMRRFGRLSLVAGALVAVAGGAMVAAPSMAAPGGGQCTLHGTATFSNPGVGAANPFTYTFDGDLSNCASSAAKGPDKGGHINAGVAFFDNNVQYAPLDTPTGTGDCASGDTQGTSVVQWADGTYSFISYTTKSAAAGVVLQGTVLASVQAVRADGTGTDTLASTKYAGNGADGLLAFEVANPTDCQSATGVTSAGIDGWTGIGSQ
jgi:hypothetical protein